MAETNISVTQDQFSCPVCLHLMKDPVTIPCGHSYCMNCITECWDQEDDKGLYSCPQCRENFDSRPALNKSTILAEMVEKLKKTKFQKPAPAHCFVGPGDVECDLCSEVKCKAIKSCLVCLTSYCPSHLDLHENLFEGKNHALKNAMALQKMVCQKHKKPLDLYCRTDQHCICYLCNLDEHKTHDIVTAVAERTEKETQLEHLQKKLMMTVQKREKHSRSSARTAVEESEKAFTELIHSIERMRGEVTKLIRDQENTAVSRAERLLNQLEQEIFNLRARSLDLEGLSKLDDHIHFLQSFKDLSVIPKSTDVPKIFRSSHLSFNVVSQSISLLKEKLEDFYKEEKEKFTLEVKHIRIIPAHSLLSGIFRTLFVVDQK